MEKITRNDKKWADVFEMRDKELKAFAENTEIQNKMKAITEEINRLTNLSRELCSNKSTSFEKAEITRQIRSLKRDLETLNSSACPIAASMAVELLKPKISTYISKANAQNYISHNYEDINQEVYLMICNILPQYDTNSKANFATFSDKWFKDIARNFRLGELSDFGAKKGYNVTSIEAINHRKQQNDSSDNSEFELIDNTADIDRIEEEKEASANQRFLIKATKNIYDTEKGKMTLARAACLAKFLGGYENFSDSMKETYLKGMAKMEDEFALA